MVRFNIPSLHNYPIQGIDISHHQGDVDWKAISTLPNVRFAIMKATEGGDFKDSKFAQNWHRAGNAGIVRGAYHFFSFCRPGKDQARNVRATVPREPGTLPMPSIWSLLATATGCRLSTNSRRKSLPL
jgi:lysozyme